MTLHPWQKKTERRLQQLEALMDFLIHDGVRAEPRPFNGQEGRKALFESLCEAMEPTRFVETGAYLGDTAGWVCRDPDGPSVWTCDTDERLVTLVSKRFPGLRVVEADARSFLAELIRSKVCTFRAFFYLDAHWGQDLPVATELELIAAHCSEFVVMVDDFEVPGDEGYGFDDYGDGLSLTLKDLGATFERLGLTAYFPTLPSDRETGSRRGCVVLCRADLTDKLDQLACLRRHDATRRTVDAAEGE